MLVRSEDLDDFITDASNMQGGSAQKLFFPESREDVADVLREADRDRIPVTISGARTGTVGGAIPFGGYIVSLNKLDNIKEVSVERRTATVQAGVILADFQKAVEAEGLFYPPDPTEWSCQMGGTVATNASGARSFKYGATRDYVNRLEIVLAGGDFLSLGRGEVVVDPQGRMSVTTEQGNTISAHVPSYDRPNVRKNVSGYYNQAPLDAIDIFIGSEGTLGIITEVEFELLPKPQGFFSGVVFFERGDDLLRFVNEARELSFASRRMTDKNPAAIDATLLEYFDDRALQFISEKFPEVPSGMEGAVFFEQETAADTEDTLLEIWNDLLERHGADLDRSWFTTNEQDREKMREFRHALPVAVNERIARYGLRKVGTDMAVPDENFPGFLKYYKETLNSSGIDYVIFGHIGDGHLHANLLPRNAVEAEHARHLYGRFIAQSVMLGGAVSAEHGIGKLKSKYLYVMMGERYLNEMVELKRAFDPNGILGRGNMFDEKFLS